MSDRRLFTITRKARIWPEMPAVRVDLPNPPHLTTSVSPLMLISLACSMLGMGFCAFFLYTNRRGIFALSLLIVSSLMLLGGALNFLVLWLTARRKRKRIYEQYRQKLAEASQLLQTCERQERQGRNELDPPFVVPDKGAQSQVFKNLVVIPIVQRSCDNRDIALWARRPDDPDFLAVRIGMGRLTPHFSINQPADAGGIAQEQALTPQRDEASALLEQYSALVGPITVQLDQGPLALLGSAQRLTQARDLACVLLGHLTYHHSPEDVRIIVLASDAQRATWEWLTLLPHTLLYDPRNADEPPPEQQAHAVALGNEAVLQMLPQISREVSRRELLLGDSSASLQGKDRPVLPQLVIVVDHFDEIDDLDPTRPSVPVPNVLVSLRQQKMSTVNRPFLTVAPLRRPEMTLALNAGKKLGIAVLAISGSQTAIPPTTEVLIDLDSGSASEHGPADSSQARVRRMQSTDAPIVVCDTCEKVSRETLRFFAQRLQSLRPATARRLELRTQVDLCTLFEPHLDLVRYDPYIYWNDPGLRTAAGMPLMRIPIGLKVGDETQYLDLMQDGPHGLLIGQTGAGKSELLQTIITALAVAYRPTEVDFLLIDYKAGMALEPFSQLPHTIGFLSNVSSPALIQRFITLLRAEVSRRELRLKEGKATPRLVIVIDEFAEMVRCTETLLDDLFAITRIGHEVGMHFLLAAQRPEGVIGSKVRDYVQYRLCLRCASAEDSREVLRRVDAAMLPASVPGRGYLLHGDNQLDLFQAARVSIPTASPIQKQFALGLHKA